MNIILPEQVIDNLDGFRRVYAGRRLGGQVYFAHKANPSSAIVRELAAGDAGVDVASLGELQHGLGAGFAAHRIMATGPKSREFLWLAARVGAIVNADSLDELSELASIVTGHRLARVRVMSRLSGFLRARRATDEPAQPFRRRRPDGDGTRRSADRRGPHAGAKHSDDHGRRVRGGRSAVAV